MAGETGTTVERKTGEGIEWAAGAVGGLVGGIVFAAMIQAMMRPILVGAIPALWGLSGLAAGWVVHLVNATLFGVLFAATVESTGLRGYVTAYRTSWAVGGGWGVTLWILGAGLVMPLWLGAVGFPMAPPFPNLNPQTLPGHVVYGVVLGLVYPSVRGR